MASPSSASPADLTKSYLYDGLGRRTLEKTRNLAGDLTAATAMVYDGEQIAYEQQLRLDGANNQTGTAVISYASILCALPEAATSCRITTRWYTPSDITDDMIAATPDVASATAGTPASPTINGGTIPQGTSSPSAASYAYHTDHQGSVRAITDDAGQIVNAYAYDAYGNPEEAVESLTQPYRYTGREWNGVARLYHYRARAYDAETGRFLQEDPLWFNAGDLNVYRYVGNNPVNGTDPSGKFQAGERGALTGIIGNLVGWNATRLVLARAGQFSTQRKTTYFVEQFVKRGEALAISVIAARISCKLYQLASALMVPDDSTLGAATTCGYDYVPNPTETPPLAQPQPKPEEPNGDGPEKPKYPGPPPAPVTSPPPEPRTLPKGDPDTDENCLIPTHRGRIQIQGQTRTSARAEISWPWARCSAPTKTEGLAELQALFDLLTQNQKNQREDALSKAQRAIRSGPLSVGFRGSYKNREYLNPEPLQAPRVDIEVQLGEAFVN